MTARRRCQPRARGRLRARVEAQHRPRADLCARCCSGPSSACSRSTGRSRPRSRPRSTSRTAISIPWLDFQPDWKGWRSLGLSPDTIGNVSTVRDEFLQRFGNSIVASVGGSLLAIVIGSLAAYGLTPLRVQVRPLAQQGHLVLLPVAADPAAGRPRPAVPGPLQGAGAARHQDRADPDLHADGAADRDLDHARPVRRHPDRARAGGARRRRLGLGRLPAHRAADRAARHGGGLHPFGRAVLERVFLRRRC